MPKQKKDKERIGWREWATFPDLALPPIKAKIDTGARTSSLHAVDIRHVQRAGQDWVRFEVHPAQRSTKDSHICEAEVHDIRRVRSSNGKEEERIVIRTMIELGSVRAEIDLNLSSRSDMGFRLLLGREAMRKRFIVDPGLSYLCGRLHAPKRAKT